MNEFELVTYRRADGELIADEYAFVTDLDFFDDYEGAPLELIEEHWVRSAGMSITIGTNN